MNLSEMLILHGKTVQQGNQSSLIASKQPKAVQGAAARRGTRDPHRPGRRGQAALHAAAEAAAAAGRHRAIALHGDAVLADAPNDVLPKGVTLSNKHVGYLMGFHAKLGYFMGFHGSLW